MSFSNVTIGSNAAIIPVDTRVIPKVLLLPTVSTNSGRYLLFKDYYGTSSNSTFTISTTGTDLIDDYNFRYTFSNAFGSMSFVSDGLRSWRTMDLYNGALTPSAGPGVITSGGTLSVVSGVAYNTFTTSGTLTVTGRATMNYLIVGGGGGGGDRHGGGGGAGGVLSGTFAAVPGTYTVTVGAAGVAGNYESGGLSPAGVGGKGGDSSITGVATAYGGGGGGTYDGNPTGTFGSGGGGGGSSKPGIAGTAGQGNTGGSGNNPGGGGGGGAGAVGANADTSTGGIGVSTYSVQLLAVGYGTTFATSPQSPLSGGVAYIAGGGGGAANTSTAPTSRAGGLGGGGTGDWDDAVITAGTSNTGGGGGASRSNNTGTTGRAGGTGLVLIWYNI